MSPWTNVALTPAWRPAPLQEFDDGLDLRAHAAGRELAVREVLLRLGDRHAIEELLGGLAEIQGDLGDVRRDYEVLPSDRLREDGCRVVLVNYGLDADEFAVLADDRNPTASRGNHDASIAVPDEHADDVLLDDVHRPRGRHDSPPTPALVVRHLPAFRFLDEDLVVPQIIRTDRFRRIREGRIAGVDEDLRHDAGDVPMDLSKGELVAKGLREEVPDQRLALRAAHVEGHRRDQVPRLLVFQEDVADLRAVAVRHDDVMSGRHEVRETGCGRLDPAALGRRVRGLARGLKRVPANRYDKLRHPSDLDGSLVLSCRGSLHVRQPVSTSIMACSMGPA